MKQFLTIKENGWHWPVNGDYTWQAVTGALDIHNKITPYLKQTNVAIQAGGNGGLMVAPLAKKFKSVYTFEPEPLNFYCLTINVTSSNVFKYQACLGNKRGTVCLNNLFSNDNGAFYVDGTGETPVLMIDDLGLTDCNLIFLDIEGQEYFALLGGIETIKKYKPVIVMEHCIPWMQRYNISVTEINSLLIDQLGYNLVSTFQGDSIYACTKQS